MMFKQLITMIILVGLSACATPVSTEPVEVTIFKYQFIPAVVEIKQGQTVRWVNKEKRQYHSVWFEKNGEVESDYLFPEDFLDKSFNKPGVFIYKCGPHPEMFGRIIVK